jgi:hypothetical protein
MSAPDPRIHAFPDLRFVPVDSLVPHERHDELRFLGLVKSFREDPVLRNPPIVTPIGPNGAEADSFVVLDGANRASAARTVGWPHMVVQVVPYEEPAVRLSTWYHALGDYTRDDFEKMLRAVPGLECRRDQPGHASAVLARRDALASVVFADGGADTLHGGRDLKERNALLNGLVDTYRESKRYFRVTSDSLAEARERQPEVTALVVFPHFEPCEVIELAASGDRVPAGITRHLVRWRALRINIAIQRLTDATLSLVEKNRWLQEWLHGRLLQRQVRFYEEPTVLFEE